MFRGAARTVAFLVDRMAFSSVNPTTGEVLWTFPETSDAGLEEALGAADKAQRAWRHAPFAERTAALGRVAVGLRAGAARFARTMALEMGKPLAQGEAEVEKCAATCDHFAAHAERLLAPEPVATEARRAYVRFDPLGVVFAIMPWNFPFWQVFRFAAPTLMAGNAVLLKHAPNVSRCAIDLEQIFADAGVPGLFRSIRVDVDRTAAIVADVRVQAVTLTGSTRAGSAVAGHAGRAIKKAVLELGGNDAFIVLADADVDRAARVAAEARLLNSGQSCIAAKRFIASAAVADRFLAAFVAELGARKLGDPLVAGTQLGPQARTDLRANLHRQVELSVARGARIALGGALPEGPGAFYPATALDAVAEGMPAFDEETFGPVAAVIRARDDDDAIALANRSPYGLGASLWTADRERAERLAVDLEVGSVFVNAMVRSDPRLPFGGVKRSGHGRELSAHGIRELTNVKTVWVE